MTDARAINEHYGFGGIMDAIEAGLASIGKDLGSLTVDDLAPVDEFHTRGRESTAELAALADLRASDRVLDVGCGLGGTARFIARNYECEVTGIDLTEEYVAAGRKLTELVGLQDRVGLEQASALQLPFEDGTFDVVWTEHVQMNISDKRCFYSEIARVLRPGGRFLFHDIFRGPGDVPFYPVPWAEDESLSALATEHQVRTMIVEEGLDIAHWIGKVQESLEFFKGVFARLDAGGAPPIGIHLLMGDNAAAKLRNYVRNLSEERIAVAIGIAHARAGNA